jgi:hypothetical protein
MRRNRAGYAALVPARVALCWARRAGVETKLSLEGVSRGIDIWADCISKTVTAAHCVADGTDDHEGMSIWADDVMMALESVGIKIYGFEEAIRTMRTLRLANVTLAHTICLCRTRPSGHGRET